MTNNDFEQNSKLSFMKLNPTPFDMIKSGEKTIEPRLFDEKRKALSLGDEIIFTNNTT